MFEKIFLVLLFFTSPVSHGAVGIQEYLEDLNKRMKEDGWAQNNCTETQGSDCDDIYEQLECVRAGCYAKYKKSGEPDISFSLSQEAPSLVFTSAGTYAVFAAPRYKEIKVVDLDSKQIIQTINTPERTNLRLSIGVNELQIAGFDNHNVYVWNILSAKMLFKYSVPEYKKIRTAKFSKDGKHLIVGTEASVLVFEVPINK
jgi:hypothetical protein